MQDKVAVITGGNSGIGLGTADSSFVVGHEFVVDGGMSQL